MNLKTANTNILDQLEGLIHQLSQNDFTTAIEVLNGSTIGQHIRHTLEFFMCLNDGIAKGVVNYDKRAHDKAMESDKFLALEYISKIKSSLNEVDEAQALTLEVCYDTTEGNDNQVPTNVARELAYNVEHAVHHMAIMKIGVKAIRPDIKLARDFGVAVSTIRYQQEQFVAE